MWHSQLRHKDSRETGLLEGGYSQLDREDPEIALNDDRNRIEIKLVPRGVRVLCMSV